MRRFGVVLLCLLFSGSLLADDSWRAPYEKGIAAAEKGDWNAAAEAMQKAAAAKPDEDAGAQIGASGVPYLPWYWLGISLLNGGDTAGAIDALERSASQGAVQKTTYFSSLQNALTIAKSQKGRSLKQVTAEKKADEAIGRAMTQQITASAAGAASDAGYRLGTEKLRAAFNARKADTMASLQDATQNASEAATLFIAAAQEARARKQSAKVPAAAPTPVPVETKPASPPVVAPTPAKVIPKPATAPQRVIASEPPAAPKAAPPSLPPAARPALAPPLADAFRAFARGELDSAEREIGGYLGTNSQSADALMLRGCIRYTRGILHDDAVQLTRAGEDFRAALRLRPGSTIDERIFSPKLVAWFRSIRSERK